MRTRLQALVRVAKHNALVLWLAARDPRTPWTARLICAISTAYVFSPIQLLPDWLPVVGYIDDAAAVALGGWLAFRLMPRELVEELSLRARSISEQPTDWRAAGIVLLIWLGLTACASLLAWRLVAPLVRP